jgi:phage tail protein X
MARTYTTKPGDMLDLICFRHYERRQAGAVEVVLEANRHIGLADYGPVLPRGLVITLPDLPAPRQARRLQNLWD